MVGLRLIPIGHDGSVRLIACDEHGNRMHHGNLLDFRSDGRIHRFSGINPEFGFDLDEYGKIMLRDI